MSNPIFPPLPSFYLSADFVLLVHSEHRKQEYSQRLTQFSKDFGMERLYRILHRASMAAIFRSFITWKMKVEGVLRREKENALVIIVRFFRSRLLWKDGRSFLARLRTARNTKCALHIQKTWRAHVAKSQVSLLQQERERVRAANVVQGLFRIRNAYRRYKALKFLWEQSEMKHRSAIVIQLLARRVKARRQVQTIRESMIKETSKLLEYTLHKVQRQVAAIKVQLAYRSHGAKSQLAKLALEALQDRAARTIQDAYRLHQMNVMIANLLLTLDVSVTTCGNIVRTVERHLATKVLQQRFRETQIKHLVHDLVARTNAAIVHAVTTVQSACRGRIARNQTKMERMIIEARRSGAIRIQKRVRIMQAHNELQRRKDAKRTLLAALLSRLNYSRTRKLRVRVLKGWRRKRRLALHRPLIYWRKVVIIEKEERMERVQKLYMKSAKRFWARNTRVRLMRQWKTQAVEKKKNRMRVSRALAFMRSRLASRSISRWLVPVLARRRHKRRLANIFIACCECKALNSSRQLALLELAYKNENGLHKRHIWSRWWDSVCNTRRRMSRAAAFHELSFRRRMLPFLVATWKEFVRQLVALRAMLSDASDFANEQLAKRMFKKYRRLVYEIKQSKLKEEHAVRFCTQKTYVQTILAWKQSVTGLQQQKAKMNKAIRFFSHSKQLNALQKWKTHVQYILEERNKLNRALQNMRKTCMAKPFRTWRILYLNIRERREQDASRILQRFVRKRLGLMLLMRKRLKLQYEFELAVKNEIYVHMMRPSALKDCLRNAYWRRKPDIVFVHFYAEWCKNNSLSRNVKKEFATVATLIQRIPYLKNRILLVKAEALQKDRDEQESAVTRFSLKEVPLMYLFWQGQVADPFHPLWKGISGAYDGSIDRNAILAFLTKMVGAIDALQSKVAVKMQCRARVWKAKKVLHRMQQDEEERKRLAEIARKKKLKMQVTIVWIEKFDEEKGVKYWVNEKTGQKRYSMPEKGAMPTALYMEWKAARRLQAIFRGWKGRIQAELESMTPDRYPHALLCATCGDTTIEDASVAPWVCFECDIPLCGNCWELEHCTGAKVEHQMLSLDWKACHEQKRICGNCDRKRAVLACRECTDAFCSTYQNVLNLYPWKFNSVVKSGILNFQQCKCLHTAN